MIAVVAVRPNLPLPLPRPGGAELQRRGQGHGAGRAEPLGAGGRQGLARGTGETGGEIKGGSFLMVQKSLVSYIQVCVAFMILFIMLCFLSLSLF